MYVRSISISIRFDVGWRRCWLRLAARRRFIARIGGHLVHIRFVSSSYFIDRFPERTSIGSGGVEGGGGDDERRAALQPARRSHRRGMSIHTCFGFFFIKKKSIFVMCCLELNRLLFVLLLGACVVGVHGLRCAREHIRAISCIQQSIAL
jgi:hypothetical protein